MIVIGQNHEDNAFKVSLRKIATQNKSDLTKAAVIFLGSYLIGITKTYQPLHIVVVLVLVLVVLVVGHFYVALFSALEQIHCACM